MGDECSSVHNNGAKKRIKKYYGSSHNILLVGEGDFSFAVCLAKAFGTAENMIATSFDSKEVLMTEYSNAMSNLKELEDRRCTVLHDVDAHTMNRHPHLRSKLFDRVVFNFPHAGFTWKEHNDYQIKLHQELVRGFMRSSIEMLTEKGEIHITHKTAYPFNRWEIVELGKEIGLFLLEEMEFERWCYPGYINRKGSGTRIDETFPVGECSTFKFAK